MVLFFPIHDYSGPSFTVLTNEQEQGEPAEQGCGNY